jgi:hypothetical protein
MEIKRSAYAQGFHLRSARRDRPARQVSGEAKLIVEG